VYPRGLVAVTFINPGEEAGVGLRFDSLDEDMVLPLLQVRTQHRVSQGTGGTHLYKPR